MIMEKNICEFNLENLSKYENLVKQYCEKNNLTELKKVPMSSNTIYFTKSPDDNEK